MNDITTVLEQLAGEPIQLHTHPSGYHRYIPVGPPAASAHAGLWRERGNGGWHHDPSVAAVALAFDLGWHSGRADAEPPAPKVTGKIEAQVVGAVGALTAAGSAATEHLVVEATVARMPAHHRVRAIAVKSARRGRSRRWSYAARW